MSKARRPPGFTDSLPAQVPSATRFLQKYTDRYLPFDPKEVFSHSLSTIEEMGPHFTLSLPSEDNGRDGWTKEHGEDALAFRVSSVPTDKSTSDAVTDVERFESESDPRDERHDAPVVSRPHRTSPRPTPSKETCTKAPEIKCYRGNSSPAKLWVSGADRDQTDRDPLLRPHVVSQTVDEPRVNPPTLVARDLSHCPAENMERISEETTDGMGVVGGAETEQVQRDKPSEGDMGEDGTPLGQDSSKGRDGVVEAGAPSTGK